jgi:hypothetical protein
VADEMELQPAQDEKQDEDELENSQGMRTDSAVLISSDW